MKKKEYIQPEFEIVLLEQENVVTAVSVSGKPWDTPGTDIPLDNTNETDPKNTFSVVWDEP